ncbi:MAG TPA: hypothetical protein VHF58_04020 [Solirubrobacterales bacterium]|nr:hypothetical protein [Solirubrobacterales bacterium]
MIAALNAAAAAEPSAGGAPLDQLAIIGGLYWGGSAALVWLVLAHRAGRTQLLARAAAALGRVFGAPGWVALPVFVAAVSLLLTMGGGFWDIGYHIDYGRDDGPLGNPGHYPMLFGFFGTFAAGILAAGLAREADASPAWLRIRDGWHVPVGAVLLLACAGFGLLALPLDDLWHRIFGQDVTLWSPTHFMLLGGGTMSVIGMAVLVAEGIQTRRRRRVAANGNGQREAVGEWARFELNLRGTPRARVELRRSIVDRAGILWAGFQKVALIGGMLVGLEAFLAEYDWGVPLYRQVWQPLLLAAFSAFVFVAARAWAGRGGALGAWGVYIVVRSLATLIPVAAGRSPSVMPLLLVGALCVELVALRAAPSARPLAFGAVAGLACGTLGMAGEYAWSHVLMPLPWTPALIPEGLPSAAIAGTAGGMLGALLATALRAELPARRRARGTFVGAFAVLLALGVNAGIREEPQATARFELTEVTGEPDRTALATVRIDPASAADSPNWLYVLAWQGGPGTQRIVDRLESVGDGVYRSTEPIPLYGSWKSGLRLQNGRARGAAPIRLPADDALAGSGEVLPASFDREEGEMLRSSAGAELTAPASFSRPFLDDGTIILRETKDDVPGWLWTAAIAFIFVIYAGFIAGIALGVARLSRRGRDGAPQATRSAPRAALPGPALERAAESP